MNVLEREQPRRNEKHAEADNSKKHLGMKLQSYCWHNRKAKREHYDETTDH